VTADLDELDAVTRVSLSCSRACCSRAISSGSECAAKWARLAMGEVQKSYSARLMTS
jgi:hypothetical protein